MNYASRDCIYFRDHSLTADKEELKQNHKLWADMALKELKQRLLEIGEIRQERQNHARTLVFGEAIVLSL
jgi:hypothetical protein